MQEIMDANQESVKKVPSSCTLIVRYTICQVAEFEYDVEVLVERGRERESARGEMGVRGMKAGIPVKAAGLVMLARATCTACKRWTELKRRTEVDQVNLNTSTGATRWIWMKDI